MKKTLWTFFILLCGYSTAEAKIVDRVYAQVNDDIITLSDVNRRMESIRRDLSQNFSGDDLEQALQYEKDHVLDVLIQEKLLIQKAIELGIDAEVEPEVSSEIQRVMKQNNIETMEKFEEVLEDQGTNLSDFRDLVTNKLMADKVELYFVRSRITLMADEVDRYYKDHASEFASPEEVTLSEIIITSEAEGGEKEAESRARDLCDRLRKGESFSSLVSQYSRGATANKGGSIGSNLLEKWHPDIVKAIAGLEEGDVSEPQKVKEGYAIYRVDERKHSSIPSLEEVETSIKNRLFNEKYEPELERFVNRLKDEAYIQIYPDPE